MTHRKPITHTSHITSSCNTTCALLFLCFALFAPDPSRHSAHAAKKAPLNLTPGKSCTNGKCHQAQLQYPHRHGTTKTVNCSHCHTTIDPKKHLFQPTSQGKSCASCHKKYAKQHNHRKSWKFVHGPVAVNACVTCHNPHGSKHKHLLHKKGAQVCLSCHKDVSTPQPGQRVQHSPWKKKKCLTCHDAHGTKNQHLIRNQIIKMCLSCHKKTKAQLAQNKTHHGAMLTQQKCLNCHTGHAAKHKHLLARRAASLCLKCHDQPVARKNLPPITNIAAELRRNPVHHDPMHKGSCTSCHKAHGSPHPSLLLKTNPVQLYTSFSKAKYALCFSCHDASIVTEKQTLTATKFRNGAFNLHTLHVNRKKGRSCQFCHASHTSKAPRLMRQTVTFGQWKLPIGYNKTPQGGTCRSACHTPRAYRRDNPLQKGYEDYKRWLNAPPSLIRRKPAPPRPLPATTTKRPGGAR